MYAKAEEKVKEPVCFSNGFECNDTVNIEESVVTYFVLAALLYHYKRI